MSCLPKPVLRGHLSKSGVKLVVGAMSFGVLNASLYHFLVAVPREKKYNEFLRTYDEQAHYAELVKYGYLQSAKNN